MNLFIVIHLLLIYQFGHYLLEKEHFWHEKTTVDTSRPWFINNFSTRFSYASLWRALVFAEANGIKENSVKLDAGEDLYVLFAGILAMRPWNRVIDPAVVIWS